METNYVLLVWQVVAIFFLTCFLISQRNFRRMSKLNDNLSKIADEAQSHCQKAHDLVNESHENFMEISALLTESSDNFDKLNQILEKKNEQLDRYKNLFPNS